jgi:hypothetical protein
VNKEFRRALALLNKQELFEKSIRFRYMAALCLAECQEWEECLNIVGADDTPETLTCKVGHSWLWQHPPAPVVPTRLRIGYSTLRAAG